MKRILSVLIAACLLTCGIAAASAEAGAYTPGTYTAESRGMQPMTISVELSEDAIVSIDIVEHAETYGIGTGVNWKISLRKAPRLVYE